MKALLILCPPLLFLAFLLWWEHYRSYYRTFYPECPVRRAFREFWGRP